jgi:NADH dehydrogenase/NADH:ubiquinone oxidoreductase subunit G
MAGTTPRYGLNKRAVEEKYMGPLIKTVMTRCIQCTRCVRFISEWAGVEEIGLVNRGEDAEITTYLESAVTSELSGNVIDLCPVGALTSKPWAFNYRPWELKKTDSVDVMDAMGSNIRVDARGNEVMRVLPRVHDEVNEEWISDKTRFACDGLMRQRLDRPYVRRGGRLQEATWGEALAAVAERLRSADPDRVGAIAGDLQDAESMKAALDLFGALGVRNLDCRQDGAKIGGGAREGWLFNTTFSGLETCDALLLVGTNPRREAPVLNARIRKRWLNGALTVGLIGEAVDLTYDVEHVGAGPRSLDSMAAGRFSFEDVLAGAKHPAIVVGQGALSRPDGAAILRLAAAAAERANMVREGWNGFNVLHTAAARVGALDLGFLPGRGRPGRRGHADAGRAGRAVPAGRGRVRCARRRGRVRGVPGHARGRGGEPGGRDPAGRRLHREVGAVRVHRRPRADGQPRGVPRRATRRRTGRFFGPCRSGWGRPCRTTAWRRSGRGSSPSTRRSGAWTGWPKARRSTCPRSAWRARSTRRRSRARCATSSRPTRSPAPA